MNLLPKYDIINVSNPVYNNNENKKDIYALFRNNDLISLSIKDEGVFDADIIKVCLKFLTDKNKNVLDIGANIGSFTIPVAKNINGTVYSFEVQRHIFMQLCTNCFLNRLSNVYPIFGLITNKEICDISKYTEIPIVNHYETQNTGSFSINQDHIQNSMKIGASFPPNVNNIMDKVQNLCIDDLNLSNIGFIKIDVEGHELDVIKGLKDTIIRNDFPPILFESFHKFLYLENNANITLDYIKSIGYEIYQIENNITNLIAFKKGFQIF
jgi:FkbM family methyltransferase